MTDTKTRRIEVISRIQSMYSKGTASDDTRLSARHIYSKMKTSRSFLALIRLKCIFNPCAKAKLVPSLILCSI